MKFKEKDRPGRPGGGWGTAGGRLGSSTGDSGASRTSRVLVRTPLRATAQANHNSSREKRPKEREGEEREQKKEKLKSPCLTGSRLRIESPVRLWDPARGEGPRYLHFS